MGTFYYQATDGGVRGSTAIVALYSGGLLLNKIEGFIAPDTVFKQVGVGEYRKVEGKSPRA